MLPRPTAPRCCFAILPLAALLAALGGCRPAQGPCATSTDCLPREVCVEDQCRSVCNRSSDCAAGRACVNGACLPVAGVPDAATADRAVADAVAGDGLARDGASSDGPRADDAVGPDVQASDAGAPGDCCLAVDATGGRDAATAIDATSATDAPTGHDLAGPADGSLPVDGSLLADGTVAVDATAAADAGPAADGAIPDPCAAVRCSANASCVVVNLEPVCRCDVEQCAGGYCRAADECCDAADCGAGSWTCAVGFVCACVTPLVVCGSDCRVANACGGCAPLTARPGDPCGSCGTWACAGTEVLECRNEQDRVRYYHDGDDDTYGSTAYQDLCAPASPYDALRGGDCDDSDATMYPGAPELCDGKDNDCSSSTDDGAGCEGGAAACCGTPLGCQQCCTSAQCGVGDLWGCYQHVCECDGILCGVGADAGCWECCRDLDCGSATQWDCMGHSCEPMCGGMPC